MTDLTLELKARMLRHGTTICTAESLTAGHLQSMIASVSGSSEYFEGGVTAYNIDQKVNLLGVDRIHAAQVNCVSDRVAIEMACGARKLFRADIGIATTGYAEPSSDEGVAEPFAFFAIDFRETTSSGRIDGNRLRRVDMQKHVAQKVLEHLIQFLDAQ